ncbi:MAG: HEAT repeat domain-containing protein [Haloferacaceae archaeon]
MIAGVGPGGTDLTDAAVPGQALDAYVSITLVVWVGIVVLALLIASGSLTLGKSVSEYYADRRREAVEDSVRTQLTGRLEAEQPDLSPWVESLSEAERDVLVEQVTDLAAVLSGSNRHRLVELAGVLGLREAARESIESGNRRERLRGLSTLIRFDWAVDPEWLVSNLADSPAEREAAIRLLSVDPTEDDRWLGVDLAFAGERLSIYGVDALFRLSREDPSPLLHQLDRGEIEDPQLLVQALLVIGQVETAVSDAPLDGVVGSLGDDRAAVRAEACRALGGYGWRSDVRGTADVGALLSDPADEVRIAAYRTLGEWGDTDATDQLVGAARAETAPRAKLAALQELGEEAGWVLETDLRRDSVRRLQPWIDARGDLQPGRDVLL